MSLAECALHEKRVEPAPELERGSFDQTNLSKSEMLMQFHRRQIPIANQGNLINSPRSARPIPTPCAS
jgi:hypothetical protein